MVFYWQRSDDAVKGSYCLQRQDRSCFSCINDVNGYDYSYDSLLRAAGQLHQMAALLGQTFESLMSELGA